MRILICQMLLLCLLGSNSLKASSIVDTLTYQEVLVNGTLMMKSMKNDYENILEKLNSEEELINLQLIGRKRRSGKRYTQLLEQKIQLQEQKKAAELILAGDLLSVRYKKGIDLIRLMYEKLLGLDHHFTSLQTFHNISMLSNPHTYPRFREAKETLREKENKRFSMRLPSILDSNPFLTATFSLVSTLMGTGKQEEKEKDFGKISCILDFTVRMNSDLNLIRHETEYLKTGNRTLMDDCEKLFSDYAGVIGYHVPLETCRKNDDWAELDNKLQEFKTTMSGTPGSAAAGNPTPDQINMEFATQKVADFITAYTNYVNDGVQYYQKFDNIISTYENEDACQEQLPRQFNELKFDIKSTIEKFNNTYSMPEIQGSRLKALLFGAI